jgi:hypothetical protein
VPGVRWEPDWQDHSGGSHEAGNSCYCSCHLVDYCDVVEDQIGAFAEDLFQIGWVLHNHALALGIVSIFISMGQWKTYFVLKAVENT